MAVWSNADLIEWAHGDAEVDDDDLLSNVTQYELASPYVNEDWEVDKIRDRNRLDIMGDLISDKKATTWKRGFLLGALVERLKESFLENSNDDEQQLAMSTSMRESFSEWSVAYMRREDIHPIMREFCEVAQKLLSNLRKYSLDMGAAGEKEDSLKRLQGHNEKMNAYLTLRTQLD